MISCGARLAVFDIAELREVTAYDELELDTLGDRKTALFLIMSDTDDSFNFLISMCYTQLFNLLCEKADDVYGGRLPVHVRCLIDECANIGQIPKLEKLVATIETHNLLNYIKESEPYKKHAEALHLKISYLTAQNELKKSRNSAILNVLLYIISLLSAIGTLDVIEAHFGVPFKYSFIIVVTLFILGLFWGIIEYRNHRKL